MQRAIDCLLLSVLYATISVCLPMIEGPIQDGHWIFWGGLITSLLGLGALLYSIVMEIKEDLF